MQPQKKNHLDIMRILLAHPGVVVTKTDRNEYAPIHIAVQKGFFEATKLLIEAKALVNQKAKGEPPLNIAAAQGHDTLVELLVQSGATVDTEGLHDLTALHCAAKANAPVIIQILADAGAFLEARADGKTSLHLAVEHSHVEAVQAMLINGADARAITDMDEETPLDLAKKQGHEEMITVLKAHLRSHPQTAVQAQLLSEDDAEQALHFDMGALVSELPNLVASLGDAQTRAIQGQEPNLQMPAVWGETLSSTGDFFSRQTAGIQAQRPARPGVPDQQPAATAMLNLFGNMGSLMQQAGHRNPQAGLGNSQTSGVQPQGLFDPFKMTPGR